MKQINNIDDFLGASETRYFSHGFRFVNFLFKETDICKNQLIAKLEIKNIAISCKIRHLGGY
jgi:hypothetical protein